MNGLPEPDDQDWSAVEREAILTAYREGQLVPKPEDERLEIKIINNMVLFRGYTVAVLTQVAVPETVKADFEYLLLGLDTE
jgi:hypothetical protein